eukprot:9483501-Pyramimonas_sp.AAC.1
MSISSRCATYVQCSCIYYMQSLRDVASDRLDHNYFSPCVIVYAVDQPMRVPRDRRERALPYRAHQGLTILRGVIETVGAGRERQENITIHVLCVPGLSRGLQRGFRQR